MNTARFYLNWHIYAVLLIPGLGLYSCGRQLRGAAAAFTFVLLGCGALWVGRWYIVASWMFVQVVSLACSAFLNSPDIKQ